MLSLRGLTKRYGVQTAVDHLSLEVPAGQIVGLLGPNGAGKTTTLRMVTGLLKPDDGTALIAGRDITLEPVEAKRVLGFVPDSGAVYESLTGMEYLLMVASLYGIEESAAVERVARFIEFFELGMDTLENKLLGAYSKGMRRKVVITAALLHQPKVVFLDEPLDGLDANAAVGFKALLETLAREGKTIVYSSHILDVVQRVCHRVAIIHQGRLLVDGSPENLIREHAAASLEQLFTRLTGAHDHEQRAESFARSLRS
ncbi:ABC transporter ATP-binding protein [Verrucomicrobium spinosum]|uniref:ABC transporter ATP-binding protein n=1 Tax=Verrucomicrobium spinosum TaxID=2736 RepID=UPI00017443CE|nr:ABC transporter ATP-binding protein [Verrucomicrobium spinosum]